MPGSVRKDMVQMLVYARELKQLYEQEKQLRGELKRSRGSLKDSNQKVLSLTVLLQQHLKKKEELDLAYQTLVDGVRRLLLGEEPPPAGEGGEVVGEGLPRQGLSAPGRRSRSGSFPLTGRELEILQYVAEGYSNKQIASVLTLTEHTIKNHLTSIMKKLGARDRAHSVVLALRQGRLYLGASA